MPRPYRLVLTLPGLPEGRLNNRGHWAKLYEHDLVWKRAVWAGLQEQHLIPDAPLQRVGIHCVRYSARELDYEQLVGSFKPLVDALTELDVIADDRTKHVVQRRYDWRQRLKREGPPFVQMGVFGGKWRTMPSLFD